MAYAELYFTEVFGILAKKNWQYTRFSKRERRLVKQVSRLNRNIS